MDGGRRQLVGIDLTIVIGPSGWPIICKESIVTPTLRGERTNFSSLASNGIRADASTDIEEGGGSARILPEDMPSSFMHASITGASFEVKRPGTS